MTKPFENRYCPRCLSPVDPDSGDHWDGCEYEQSVGNWINPRQPLTELELLTRFLEDAEGGLLRALETVEYNKQRIIDLKCKIASKG